MFSQVYFNPFVEAINRPRSIRPSIRHMHRLTAPALCPRPTWSLYSTLAMSVILMPGCSRGKSRLEFQTMAPPSGVPSGRKSAPLISKLMVRVAHLPRWPSGGGKSMGDRQTKMLFIAIVRIFIWCCRQPV